MIVLIALSLFCRIDWILVAAVILDHQASVLEWGDGGFFVNQQKRKIRSSLVQIRLSLVAARTQRLGKAWKFAMAVHAVSAVAREIAAAKRWHRGNTRHLPFDQGAICRGDEGRLT
ncbi:MAG: hypothetical protein E6Q98_05100 [Rhodospirillaceae bacterium]|nr:MAG: hypothetical protein E6Q98_05100 [Rhodospirillaceae bacterium]